MPKGGFPKYKSGRGCKNQMLASRSPEGLEYKTGGTTRGVSRVRHIRALGVSPPPDLTRFTAIELIDKLLHSVKATERQLQYIRELGGYPSAEISHAAAAEPSARWPAARTGASRRCQMQFGLDERGKGRFESGMKVKP
jgi:hypothetical protein